MADHSTTNNSSSAGNAGNGVGPSSPGVPLSVELRENIETERSDAKTAIAWTKGTLFAKVIEPGSFEVQSHWYPRCVNANLHPIPNMFMNMSTERIVARYCHLHPEVDDTAVSAVLSHENQVFRWAGADLFNVTNSTGGRKMVVVETNSCPSGQKSFPFDDDRTEDTGYYKLMRDSFLPEVQRQQAAGMLPEGGLAVIYDKNAMETSGYAAALADVSGENVFLAETYKNDPDPPVRWFKPATEDEKQRPGRILKVRTADGKWHQIRATFRYVTQAPWTRLPVVTQTFVFNPVLACLAGGRNKMVADKAYEMFNRQFADSGLKLQVPETIRDVKKPEVPMWVASMGGHAVVKNPYSNAGQGVWTITSAEELDDFMNQPDHYEKYIVQSLVGNASWSSSSSEGTIYHAGTVPDRKCRSFVCDIRMMVCATPNGFRPLAMYSRRALKPLVKSIKGHNSWEVLGTNLSIKHPDGTFTSDDSRLMQMDAKNFNYLGIGLDDLIDCFVQTCCAALAIDDMAKPLVRDGAFDAVLFSSVCADDVLLDELRKLSDAETVTSAKESSAAVMEAAISKLDMDPIEALAEPPSPRHEPEEESNAGAKRE